MDAILKSVFPIFSLIALGGVLKGLRVINDDFIRVSDWLVYYIFFPALLFWNIGKPTAACSVEWKVVAAVLGAVFVAFVLSLLVARLSAMPDREIGSFSQACYRFNTYVGMAVVMTDLGEEGGRQLGVLIGFAIPLINVLAVSSMVWFSSEDRSRGFKTALLVRSTISNPLILTCVLGIAYARMGTPLPQFLDKALSLMSLLTLPLALLAVGGSLTFADLGKHAKSSATAAAIKLLVLPVVGYCFLHAFGVQGVPFKVAMIYFVLPTSPNNYILSVLLHSDPRLSVATIVLSTLLSLPALSVTLAIFGG